MKTQTISILRSIMLLVAVLLFSQCDTTEPEPQNEEELITTLKMTFSPVGGGDDVVFSVYDEDGDGPIEPVYTNGILASNTTYNVSIEVRSPEENITEEIRAEEEEHQFFYETSVSLYLEFAYNDSDANELPVGLNTIFYAQEPSTGTLTVTLRHEPDKSAEGAINGDPSNAGGETDIQATFDVVIE